MFKTAQEFAAQMSDLCFGNLDEAQRQTFYAARVYDKVPTQFFVDVYAKLQEECELYQAKQIDKPARFFACMDSVSSNWVVMDQQKQSNSGIVGTYNHKRDAEAMAEELNLLFS